MWKTDINGERSFIVARTVKGKARQLSSGKCYNKVGAERELVASVMEAETRPTVLEAHDESTEPLHIHFRTSSRWCKMQRKSHGEDGETIKKTGLAVNGQRSRL